MKQSEKEQKTFLSICGQHDYDLLTEKSEMTQVDFERITYISASLGYMAYTQLLIGRYLDFACNASYRLYQNGRVSYGRKGSSIYYGTRSYRCNNGSV